MPVSHVRCTDCVYVCRATIDTHTHAQCSVASVRDLPKTDGRARTCVYVCVCVSAECLVSVCARFLASSVSFAFNGPADLRVQAMIVICSSCCACAFVRVVVWSDSSRASIFLLNCKCHGVHGASGKERAEPTPNHVQNVSHTVRRVQQRRRCEVPNNGKKGRNRREREREKAMIKLCVQMVESFGL